MKGQTKPPKQSKPANNTGKCSLLFYWRCFNIHLIKYYRSVINLIGQSTWEGSYSRQWNINVEQTFTTSCRQSPEEEFLGTPKPKKQKLFGTPSWACKLAKSVAFSRATGLFLDRASLSHTRSVWQYCTCNSTNIISTKKTGLQPTTSWLSKSSEKNSISSILIWHLISDKATACQERGLIWKKFILIWILDLKKMFLFFLPM